MSDAVVSEVGVVEALVQDSAPVGSPIVVNDVLEARSGSCLNSGMF